MQACDAFYDGETQADTARRIRTRRIGAVEPVKNVWQVLRGNAAAAVRDLNIDVGIILAGAQGDGAARTCVGDGVGYQVGDGPLQKRAVRVRVEGFGAMHLEGDAGFGRGRFAKLADGGEL